MFTQMLRELDSHQQRVTKVGIRNFPGVVAAEPRAKGLRGIVAACVVVFGCFASLSHADEALEPTSTARAAEVFDWNSFAAGGCKEFCVD